MMWWTMIFCVSEARYQGFIRLEIPNGNFLPDKVHVPDLPPRDGALIMRVAVRVVEQAQSCPGREGTKPCVSGVNLNWRKE